MYSGDRKAAGILIENVIQGSRWYWTIVGTGINLNQEDFDVPGADPVSVSMLTGRKYDVISMGRKLHRHLCSRFSFLSTAPPGKIMEEYNSVLYGRNREVRLKEGSIVFTATVSEVRIDGTLVTSGTMPRTFNVGEIEFVT